MKTEKKKYEMGGQRSAKELAKQGHTAPVYGLNEPVKGRRQSTKGGPFSRCSIIDITPSKGRAEPAVFHLIHPTSKSSRRKNITVTHEIIRTFMPSALPQQVNALLGF